jgi:peptide-methionine (R)-S-oxide reductase
MDTFNINKTEEQWKQELSEEQYYVIRKKGTDRPYTGKYDQHWEEGTYECAACGAELFTSNTKFDAGCGWPSFYEALDKTKIKEIVDTSHGMKRIEVVCANCGGHLGHVFDDGPKDKGGLRYCVNSSSINFNKPEAH